MILIRETTKDTTVWKKCVYVDPITRVYHYCLVKLLLPKGTRYAGNIKLGYPAYVYYPCIMDRKCRAEKAVVLGVYRFEKRDGKRLKRIRKVQIVAQSDRDYSFKYEVGKTVKPYYVFSGDKEICASGIHFFADIEDAKSYDFT